MSQPAISFMSKSSSKGILVALVVPIFYCAARASGVGADSVLFQEMKGNPTSNGIHISSPVTLVPGANLALTGGSGYILSLSSINAAAFIGDGSGVTGIVTLSSTQTLSGANFFVSSFTVRSGGREIIISTSSVTKNIYISTNGAVSFFPKLHTSNAVVIPEASTGNSFLGWCVPGSTISLTTSGGKVNVSFSGQLQGTVPSATPPNYPQISFLQDGQFVNNLSSAAGVALGIGTQLSLSETVSFSYLIDDPAPASGGHTYCLTIGQTSDSPVSGQVRLMNGARTTNLFFVKEIK
jgi:hypothetical protein